MLPSTPSKALCGHYSYRIAAPRPLVRQSFSRLCSIAYRRPLFPNRERHRDLRRRPPTARLDELRRQETGKKLTVTDYTASSDLPELKETVE